MSRRKREQRREPAAASPPAATGRFLKALAFPVALAVVAGIALVWFPGTPARRPADRPPDAPPARSEPETPPATESKPAAAGRDKLAGKWLREDGGYVLEIKQVGRDGKLDAAYFNPQPIYVARAEAKQEDDKLQVFVELRDAGYPGCTYNLTYDPQQDTLQGIYFQAAMQQEHQVLFVRAG